MNTIAPDVEVYILPSASLRFGGRWGRVKRIEADKLLPVVVSFIGDSIPYHFDDNEMITEAFHKAHKNDKTICYSCGSDTTGQFITTCEPCRTRNYEEATF